ncbi:hypothetical protein BGW37DRAFT_543806 [Umbelopsis sp. PMI_123]|nr:hypothetical protein BGW37DRAFT_543806 [Umbelopsis sp. PMI_123]
MRLHLILVWFFSFSFSQALFVKRDLVPQENLLGLEEVEKQVDAFVTIVVQLETRPIIDSVQLIAAYLKIHEAIIKSTNLCMKEEGPFTPTQAVTLIEGRLPYRPWQYHQENDKPTKTYDPLGLDTVEQQVDAIVSLVVNFEKNSKYNHPLLVVVAEQKLEYLMENTMSRCQELSSTYSSTQSHELLARAHRIVTKLQLSLSIFIDLKQEFRIFLAVKLLIERIYKLKDITDRGASCFGEHIDANYARILSELQRAIHEIFDQALAKLKE